MLFLNGTSHLVYEIATFHIVGREAGISRASLTVVIKFLLLRFKLQNQALPDDIERLLLGAICIDIRAEIGPENCLHFLGQLNCEIAGMCI